MERKIRKLILYPARGIITCYAGWVGCKRHVSIYEWCTDNFMITSCQGNDNKKKKSENISILNRHIEMRKLKRERNGQAKMKNVNERRTRFCGHELIWICVDEYKFCERYNNWYGASPPHTTIAVVVVFISTCILYPSLYLLINQSGACCVVLLVSLVSQPQRIFLEEPPTNYTTRAELLELY